MDYEKKYKDALKKVSELIRDYDNVSNLIDIKEELQDIFPELKESEDGRIRKGLITIYRDIPLYSKVIDDVRAKDIIKWLEKQGEKSQGKTALETWKDMRLEVYQQASGNRHEPNYSDDTTKMFSLNDIDEIMEKISEQKPVVKVEPKFHEGEWVVTDKNNVVQIKAIEESKYVLENTMRFSVDYVDKCWRKWTIQDAKDGDVLVYKDEISLYKHDIKNCTKQKTTFGGFVYHFCYDGKRFITNSLYSLTEQDKIDIHPANKEQRELLFQKMNEAGYEWDNEKKEVRKIERKITESEDEKIRKQILNYFIVQNTNEPKPIFDSWIDWIKKQGKQKSKWNEEDEYHWMMCLECVEECATQEREDFSKTIYWIKSIKEKMEEQ